jgi:hypothetical protein
MKLDSRFYAPHLFVGALAALGSLVLIGCDKPACADGQYVYDNYGVASQIVSYTTNSAAYFNPGQTTSASSYSNYAATASASASSGSASGSANLYFSWINSDGNSPYPTTSYNAITNGGVSGAATSSGGATAASSASGCSSSSAPADYNNSSAQESNMGNPGLAPIVQVSVSANTSAGPDNTADPSKENYGNPTASDASGQSSVTISHAILG